MGLSARKRDDADEVAWIEEQLRRARAGMDSEALLLDLSPYLIKMRYRDTAFDIDDPDGYDFYGWTAGEYGDDQATGTGLVGLIKVGSWVQAFGSVAMNYMPYDPADRDRFIPAPTYDPTAYAADWATASDNDRRKTAIGLVRGLWTYYPSATFDAHGPDIPTYYWDFRYPVEFMPWPSGAGFRLSVDRVNSAEYWSGLELQFFAGTNGSCLGTDISEAGGRLYYPDPATLTTDDGNAIPDDRSWTNLDAGLAFGNYYFDLEAVGYYSQPGHPELASGWVDVDIEWDA